MNLKVSFFLNGEKVEASVKPDTTLLNLLRDEFGLISVKEGCGYGECGACTVLLDGKPVNSCLILAPKVEGRHVTTIEGITPKDGLSPLQEAFIKKGAIQCGFCTSGMIISAHGLLKEKPDPTIDDIKIGISGNLCRCTGYIQIIEAIKDAARKKK